MTQYILRLDDACERMDVEKWICIEEICDRYQVHPLVGVIPKNKDKHMDKYPLNNEFWTTILDRWEEKGWRIALHGYEHIYTVRGKMAGGINPIQDCSEFAGESIEKQREKIQCGLNVFKEHGRCLPNVFFAPSHTYDENTIRVLCETGIIKFISDSFSRNSYQKNGITIVPVQTGIPRKIPFMELVTIAIHPNTMTYNEIMYLEKFVKSNKFTDFPKNQIFKHETKIDIILRMIYFSYRKIRDVIK